MKIRLASDITRDSIVDGPGLRTVVWTQGCAHKCQNCQNPQTHDFNGGVEVDIEEVINDLKKTKLQRGITFSGGDPMAQAEAVALIAKEMKKDNLDIWLYTGYTFETIVKAASTYRPEWAEVLKYIDVMVDGPFIQEKHDPFLKFRGSSNQRVIDIKRTLASGRIIEYGEVDTEVRANVG